MARSNGTHFPLWGNKADLFSMRVNGLVSNPPARSGASTMPKADKLDRDLKKSEVVGSARA